LPNQHRALIRHPVSLLQQQTIDPMRMDHLFTWRPREDGEAAILRSYHSDRITLIVYELCCRQVTRAAFLRRVDHNRSVSDDWFRCNHLFNRWVSCRTSDLYTERKQLILGIYYGGAINRSETGDRVHRWTQHLFP
jgi:hypothetical protein